MADFLEYVDKKKRDTRHHLALVEKLLKHKGMKVESFFEEAEPYVFLYSPKSLSFDGVRIYEIADKVVFRVQKENKTHPYGRAYLLDLQEMFNDILADHDKEEEAVKKVIESVTKELNGFFEKSVIAEDELANEPPTSIAISSTMTSAYANTFNDGGKIS